MTALFGLGACASSGITAEDAYPIACPAVDSFVAGGDVAGKATLAGLRRLRDTGALDAEPQRWLDATISLLESDDPTAISESAKQLIIQGCADHGYALRNWR